MREQLDQIAFLCLMGVSLNFFVGGFWDAIVGITVVCIVWYVLREQHDKLHAGKNSWQQPSSPQKRQGRQNRQPRRSR